MDVPYALVCAVQDLYSLHQQLSPAGPYRLALFHEQSARDAERPELLRRCRQLDLLVRAAGALLGSQLGAAVKPLAVELWQGVRRLRRELWPEEPDIPALRRLGTDLLTMSWEAPAERVYRLFGEVLAEYLLLLAALQAGGGADWEPRIEALRAALQPAA